MAGQNQGVANTEQFEAYFRRADLDQDGRISGAEAVAFLQGSNLSKQVLAQIWMHADRSHTGYLSRSEFYDFLKLVTVAQSKRELTPDIVKAALHGPASAKIPAPQINTGPSSASQLNSVVPASAPHAGAVFPTSSQNASFRGPLPQNTSITQQHFSSPVSQSVRPPLPMGSLPTSFPQQVSGTHFPRGGSVVGPGPPNSGIPNNWPSGRTGGVSTGIPASVPSRALAPLMPPVASQPQYPLPAASSTSTKASITSGNGFGSGSADLFAASESLPRKDSSLPTYPTNSVSSSSSLVPGTVEPQSSAKPDPFEVLQSTFNRQSAGNQHQQPPSQSKHTHHASLQISSPVSSSVVPAVGVSASEQSQLPWPKMTRAGVQRYTKVFMEVDTDRDGRVTGEQARNLFLSWRLPREVLKQVWDLSDQDNDSMLSLREFCIALYLMERYREGRPLPSTLPPSVVLDETLLSVAGPPTATYGVAGWGTAPGLRPQQGLPSRPTAPAGLRPDGSMQFNQQSSRGSMENFHLNQVSNGELNAQDISGVDTAGTEKQVESKEKLLLDSREEIEYYQTKMQDLVLYKSRCDNRLNEITERALADKREAESLAKKYEEKYKQVAEIASKLTIEEASFRDTQARKMELQQAIIKMEQGGSADGILQVRADRIQSDLEELLKALAERCKKHGINVKSTALIELPPGWQPGVPEVSAVWDEDWDKFEDEGFSFDVGVPENAKSTLLQNGSSSPGHTSSPGSISNTDAQSEQLFAKGVGSPESESADAHSEDETRSPHDSPTRQTMFESPAHEYSDDHFGKSFEADSTINQSFDEPAWGTFDGNDDVDSVWGFSAKDSDHEKHGESYFFESNDFGASPIKTGSPGAGKSSAFRFEDSVPATPLSRAGNSPPRYSVESRDPFDSFRGYDSFSVQDHGLSPRQGTLARFDSISSARDFDHSRGFSFDDADPFGSSGPFKASSMESQSPKKSSSWSAF